VAILAHLDGIVVNVKVGQVKVSVDSAQLTGRRHDKQNDKDSRQRRNMRPLPRKIGYQHLGV